MAVKASETFKVYENPKGPKISTVSRNVIEKSKLYFKDIDGSGKLSKVNDWRIPAAERRKRRNSSPDLPGIIRLRCALRRWRWR